jgi:hypothetical protein
MYGGAHPFSPPGTNYISVELFNNSAVGEKFFVYGVHSASGGGNAIWLGIVAGPIGINPTACFPVDASMPPGPGQIRTLVSPTVPAWQQIPFSNFADSVQKQLDAPMFVLPPGMSLISSSENLVTDQVAAFFYVPLDE